MVTSAVGLQHQEQLIDMQRSSNPKRPPEPRFHVGAQVRLVEPFDVFSKGYVQTYSKEVHEIERIFYDVVITYQLEGISHKRFYAQELVAAGAAGKGYGTASRH